MTTAKDLMPAYIAGTAGQSGALFADNGTLRDPGSAGGGNREHEYSGSVADTCRGGIDTFSFPDCRHSLGGAASPRLISPAASVYAVSRDVEVIVVRVGLIAVRLSPRQFSRVFRAETRQSPAKAIEKLRLEAAGLMLQQGRLPIEAIAKETGFGDRERMRRAFRRAYGQAPQAIRNASHPLAAI
jgi:hypothetical protein